MKPVACLVLVGMMSGCGHRGPAPRSSAPPSKTAHHKGDDGLDRIPMRTKHRGRERATGGSPSHGPKFQAVMVREMMPLLADPRFGALVKSRTGKDITDVDAVGEVTRELVGRGLRKLTPQELDQLSASKLHIAQASPTVCADFWLGGADQDEVLAVLERLPESDQVGWLRGLARAALHTLDDPGEVAHDGTALFEGIQRINQSLPPDEQQRFLASVGAGDDASDADGCYAFRSLMQGAQAFESPLRERFLRELIDPDES